MDLPLQTLPWISTERLHLRPLGPDDAEAFRTMTDEPAITRAIHFLRTPFTLIDAQRLIAGDGDGRDCFWGIWSRESGVLIGAVGAHLRGADEIEIGYWRASSVHSRGFGAEAASSIVRALGTAYPRRRIIAECRPQNEASWHLLERIGFQPEGRDGLGPGRKRFVFRTTPECG